MGWKKASGICANDLAIVIQVTVFISLPHIKEIFWLKKFVNDGIRDPCVTLGGRGVQPLNCVTASTSKWIKSITLRIYQT